MKEKKLTRVPPRISQFLLLLREPLLQGFVLDVADPERGFRNVSESLAEQYFRGVDVLGHRIGGVSYGLVGQTP